MAHEIEVSDGRASMAYVYEDDDSIPWHGLGQRLKPGVTPEEMMVAAGADWTVSKRPLTFESADSSKRISNGAFALVRDTDEKVLSPNVGPGWEPVQNQEAFDFFTAFAEAGDMEMHTAGVLRGGQIVWALAKVADDFTLFGGDKVESYLMLSTSHLYGKCTTVDFTPIRVVCMNTLSMALSNKSKQAVVLNHREKFNPDRVKELLGIASSKFGSYQAAAELLGSVQADEDTVIDYFDTMFPTKGDLDHSKNAERALELFESDGVVHPGAEFAKGSWWQAYNSVTYMFDHELCKTADTRLYHSWFGSHRARKTLALTEAVVYAEAA